MGDSLSSLVDCCGCCGCSDEAALAVVGGAGAAGVGAAAMVLVLGGRRPSMRYNNKRLKQWRPTMVSLPPTAPPEVDKTRHALLMGVNYYGTKYELDGCVNDVTRVAQYLSLHGYYIICLTDDQRDSRYIPTKVNIINGLYHLLDRVKDKKGHRVWLHFSGHGSQIKDTTGDEVDGLDETICPVDFKTPQDGQAHGMLSDDMLREIFVSKIPKGNRLFAVFDCCHSGTVLDLPFYVIPAEGRRMQLVGDQFSRSNYVECDAILLSGCADAQTSADIKDVGQAFVEMKHTATSGAGGALTTTLLYALQYTRTVLTMKQLMHTISDRLQSMGFEQIPQLSASRPYDLQTPFES